MCWFCWNSLHPDLSPQCHGDPHRENYSSGTRRRCRAFITRLEVNEQIRRQTEKNIESTISGGRSAIDWRLSELDEEWDVERTIEANASSIVLAGLGLGAFVDRRFYLVPAAVAGFLLQHAIQGWCPPIPILRRLGFRTQTEIDEERYALKMLRGDFDVEKTPAAALQAVRR